VINHGKGAQRGCKILRVMKRLRGIHPHNFYAYGNCISKNAEFTVLRAQPHGTTNSSNAF